MEWELRSVGFHCSLLVQSFCKVWRNCMEHRMQKGTTQGNREQLSGREQPWQRPAQRLYCASRDSSALGLCLPTGAARSVLLWKAESEADKTQRIPTLPTFPEPAGELSSIIPRVQHPPAHHDTILHPAAVCEYSTPTCCQQQGWGRAGV